MYDLIMSNIMSLADLSFTSNRGEIIALSAFDGEPLLIVNTASKCGLTPQYEALQEFQADYASRGLVILGFPCDQFLNQEPGSDEDIEEFCRINYGVSFTLSTKVDVNGPDTHPIFALLKESAPAESGTDITWNFTKFLVSADRTSVTRYLPKALPAEMIPQIESMLHDSAA